MNCPPDGEGPFLRRLLPLALFAALLAGGLFASDARAAVAAPSATDETVTSFDGLRVALTVFRPAGADANHRVPIILDSHGWGGSRRTKLDDPTVAAFLARGFGMVSFDQRGHGKTGGQAHVQDPAFEVRDVEAVIDRIARLDWARMESPGDPLLGAIGGSYGGAYQTMTALAEQATRPGGTRLDALAPQITWHDLLDSLAPSGVPRSTWLAALFAANGRNLTPAIQRAFVESAATGALPPALAKDFASHGPRFFTDRGVRLDIPVLFGQGISDNLFNLNQGLRNFDAMLTPAARRHSRFVAYNGGHALPNAVPAGGFDGSIVRPSDACSGTSFEALSLDFFDRALLGKGPSEGVRPHAYNLTTAGGGRCLGLDALPPRVAGRIARTVTTVGAGAPQFVPIGKGPATVAGIPLLRGKLTTTSPDNRFFIGLAVGTSPADARVVQNNVLPVRRPFAVTGEAFTAELPAVVVDLPAGQNLYLVVSPVSDMFIAHGSRIPGTATIENAVVEVPIVR